MAVKRTEASSGPDRQVLAQAGPDELKFGKDDGFHRELKRRVDRYFTRTGRKPRDCPQMYLKTAFMLAWTVASYVLLVFVVDTWWLALPLAVSFGLAMAAMGFNIQHDASHRAYSERRWLNTLMAMSLDLVGGSSHVWARKHNSIHHSYTNITGHDFDIDLGLVGRLSPHQRHLPFHRFQHWYMWLLYGLLPVKWLFFDDFHDVLVGRLGRHRLARPRGWGLVLFLGGKVLFVGLIFGIPLLLHPAAAVLLCYAVGSFVQGVALGLVFQVAHCVEEVAFPMPLPDTGRMANAWAAHQVETTVDYARGNRLLSWFIGGLNFQIEHHLFPRICHVHYPALAPLVEETCKEYGVRYTAHATFRGGLASHFRWLRRLGMGSTAEQLQEISTT